VVVPNRDGPLNPRYVALEPDQVTLYFR